MPFTTVNRSDLELLVWFLNVDRQTLSVWDRDDLEKDEQSISWDEKLFRRRLFWLTASSREDSRSLVRLQEDLEYDIASLLDPAKTAQIALQGLLNRIYEMKLSAFRRVLEPADETKETDPVSVVDVVRVRPPAKGEKDRRKPTVESLRVVETNDYNSARETLYRFVDSAIRNNTIWEIRRCLNCQKFFLRQERRLTYCTPVCETKFNNKRRLEEGYYDNRKPKQKPKKKTTTGGKDKDATGYSVYLELRDALLRGVKKDKVNHMADWLHFNRASAQEFKRECHRLDAEAHWRRLQPALKKRFKSYVG